MVGLFGGVFSFLQSILIVLYGLLILAGKACSALKNLAALEYHMGKEGRKIVIFAVSQMLSSFKELLPLSAERAYVESRVYSVHAKLKSALDKKEHKNVATLLVEKETEAQIANARVKYAKKYLMYILKSAVIIVLLSKMTYLIFIFTIIFLMLEICIKRQIQKTEEKRERIFSLYCVEQDRIYRSLDRMYACVERADNDRKQTLISVNTVYSQMYKEYSLNYFCVSIEISMWIIIGSCLFQIYSLVCLLVLSKTQKNLAFFVIIYKKIEKLSGCLIKLV
ncbi:hypothetical protein NEPAR06_1077 [Nematocida parisii]|uniref:Uncharacterized protein n=1 Tax=Nematocida parisii (strain ERTm3) TaxID=935791 RepID=I3EGE2_NEMP3|nr:uncharacterized protein NEPG_01217 [Nematocida parisii ERTm1]EIJ88289.1 hypothetical protein NEQG_01733 [Nematocida parisii ERTm3]KAI5125418.1 hypothetical protein NEPAR03_0093 [Nematocida parisii]EIJ93645.1 hypothetical protein NEPG_01217 [Nematocida parisii ERTm1]KAI5125542.1 hypothetical protein NEPAR08_0093 [Nematocida parisii]KAI5141837.1 hypothetical protein NEPAR04_1224 [Nematocida parisii]|eukprot:XP_013059045.1 hypothetical protein NEPG_01217 [Nematocida parisii ERTm1]